MFSLSNMTTMLEIIAAELLFLYSYPKRKRFYLILPAAILLAVLSVCFLPEYIDTSLGWLESCYVFFRYMLLFAVSVVAMWASFNVKLFPVLAACASGYAVEHIASRLCRILNREIPFFQTMIVSFGETGIILSELISFPVFYLIFWLVCCRPITKYRFYEAEGKATAIISILMVAAAIGIGRLPQSSARIFYPIAMCLFALLVQIYLQRSLLLNKENAIIARVMEENKKRYEDSKANIQSLNIKIHDLKYKIASLHGKLPQSEVDDVMHLLKIYDNDIHTKNEGLDILMHDAKLKCDSKGINMTFMGNGKDLDFLSIVDLYTLLGNALDNAIEASEKIADREKRNISVTIQRKEDFVCINVANYFECAVKIVDGIPLTTKENASGYHGYGFKSMELVAEKYHGKVLVSAGNHIFNLSIFLTES